MQHIAITMPGRPILEPLLIECDLSREGIALAVEALIAKLDTMDGDPDLEPSGDETDGCGGEDEYVLSNHERVFGRGFGPGCPIADEGEIDQPGERALVLMHRDRIRATRCDIVGGSRWHPEYRLRA